MKSSAKAYGKAKDERETTSRGASDSRSKRNASEQRTSARPGLVRAEQSLSPNKDDGSHGGEATESSPPGESRRLAGQAAAGERHVNATDDAQAAPAEQLAKLKDAVNADLVQQQRKRGSYEAASVGSKRVSPIKEEEGATTSPSPYAAFASSMDAGAQQRSNVSAGSNDSSKTVRASVPATPADDKPLRTPSYPFPQTSRNWSSSFLHQPFTSLSPTVGGKPSAENATPGSPSMLSEGSTPAVQPSDFMPPVAGKYNTEDPRFPTPNLYDMVLQLNSEAGIEPWWATVTNLMHDHFKAERVTLVSPLDPTDIECAPWGQRATFSMNGPEEFVPHRTVLEQTRLAAAGHDPDSSPTNTSTDKLHDVQRAKLHPERLRPRLEARHSYAGHGREFNDNVAERPVNPQARPPGPQRTVTDVAPVAGVMGPGRLPSHRLSSTSTFQHASLSNPDFSTIAGGVDVGPYAEVFPTLRALDHEVHPLIETGGVTRVLERGRVVAVTRDYASDSSESSNGAPLTSAQSDSAGEATVGAAKKFFGNYRSMLASQEAFGLEKAYEEYEQYPMSPWAQSPAPSPALHTDEDVNPFFASEEQQVEESFNPAPSSKDYSQFNQVEAIGVDCASTIIHVPLVHPTLSQPMQSVRIQQPRGRAGPPQRINTADIERKAPIAILSVLSSTVPYPHNLTKSLELFGPHLATSYASAQQFSSSHSQAISIRSRRTASGHNVDVAPMMVEPASLEDIINAEVERPHGSLSDSLTSPSEYSGRSTSSIVETPGWDPAAHGWTATRSVTGTPAAIATDTVVDYFDSKKRSGQRSRGSSASAQATPARSGKKQRGEEAPGSAKHLRNADDELRPYSIEPKQKSGKSTQEEKSSQTGPKKEPSPPNQTDSAISQRPSMRQALSQQFSEFNTGGQHSLLHSLGADLESSFGPMSTTAAVEYATPGHARSASQSEDMPPPSERLLRTIIDSVPVQIFTAKPDTGQLSWVNSKFLIYRGQEARQVLLDPWQAIHPQDRAEFLATWHRSLRTAQQLQQKVRLERFDGSFRWFYVRAAPLKDKKQRIVHWIGTMMDFHEQHVAEMNASRQQETAASEAKYRALANSSPQVVFAVNRSKGVTFCNSQWMHFSGQTEAQALGVGFMDHVHPDDLAECRLPAFDEESTQAKTVPSPLAPEPKRTVSMSATSSSGSSETERALSSSVPSSPVTKVPQRKQSERASSGMLKVSRDADGRPSYSTEVRLKSRDGDFRWHLVRVLLAEPTRPSEGGEEVWYGTCTDINDHKTLERELKETMDEKSRFLSNMSHEIRTPLNGITGMVNFLIDSSLTAEQMEHVNIIRASTEGLRGLINDILDLSKAEAGMIQLNVDWLYVRALLEEVNDLTSAMAIDKGLELNYLVEEDVPAQVKGDRFRIRQILLNIIGNAIKFTQAGEVFVRCSTLADDTHELAQNEAYIKVEVIDTGRGFTDKEASFLFKRFSQIDGSSTRQHGGSGLGLVISRQLVQLHGGDIMARGVPGEGSTFTFYIKTVLPSKHDQPPMPSPLPGVAPNPLFPQALSSEVPPTIETKPLTATSTPTPGEVATRILPRFASETTKSPSPYVTPETSRESPALSSASSEPSVRSSTRTDSLRSTGSSASSYLPDPSFTMPIKLAMPPEALRRGAKSDGPSPLRATGSVSSSDSANDAMMPTKVTITSPGGGFATPPMFSILVICPLKYSREATIQHISKTVPNTIPHQITARESVQECKDMMRGDDPVIFTHVVVVLREAQEIVALMDQVFSSQSYSATTFVVITDFAQRRSIMEQAPKYDYDTLIKETKLLFVFKPLKPSRFATIFDPRKEREMSTDRNQDSAQQVAITQKQIFEELTERLGNKDKRVLLVEDNRINQMVILKFLAKVSIPADTALDGVQCTDKVFAHPYGHYAIILCDLHMPNKDGYQTCKEIRQWERANKHPHAPIIALSANVLGDVYQKCVDAGFNSYMTKPVDFKELSAVLMKFMDPEDPSRPHELMRKKRSHGR